MKKHTLKHPPSRVPWSCQVLTRLLLLATFTILSGSNLLGQKRDVIGYYLASEYASRDTLVTPLSLPFEKLTIINYAFFYPTLEGTLVGRTPRYDELILSGVRDSSSGAVRAETGLCSLAHSHGVKVLLSIGGWEESGNFPAVAATTDGRRTFVASCADAIRQYGFDGIDIDWEYPGYGPHNGTPQDGTNFLLLLRALRDTLDVLGEHADRHMLLSIAIPTVPSLLEPLDVGAIAALIDVFNLMTYDIYGAWDPLSNHNTPLFPSAGSDTSRCIDAGFRLFRDTYGIPPDRLTIGTAFYGRSYKACADLHRPHGGSDAANFPPDGTPRYYTIAAARDRCERRWDDRAKVPYLVCQEWNSVVAYDDEESTAMKAQYVIDHGIRGIIIWELSGDFFPDGSTPLLDAIHRAFTAADRPE
jgi:chitinase